MCKLNKNHLGRERWLPTKTCVIQCPIKKTTFPIRTNSNHQPWSMLRQKSSSGEPDFFPCLVDQIRTLLVVPAKWFRFFFFRLIWSGSIKSWLEYDLPRAKDNYDTGKVVGFCGRSDRGCRRSMVFVPWLAIQSSLRLLFYELGVFCPSHRSGHTHFYVLLFTCRVFIDLHKSGAADRSPPCDLRLPDSLGQWVSRSSFLYIALFIYSTERGSSMDCRGRGGPIHRL